MTETKKHERMKKIFGMVAIAVVAAVNVVAAFDSASIIAKCFSLVDIESAALIGEGGDEWRDGSGGVWSRTVRKGEELIPVYCKECKNLGKRDDWYGCQEGNGPCTTMVCTHLKNIGRENIPY